MHFLLLHCFGGENNKKKNSAELLAIDQLAIFSTSTGTGEVPWRAIVASLFKKPITGWVDINISGCNSYNGSASRAEADLLHRSIIILAIEMQRRFGYSAIRWCAVRSEKKRNQANQTVDATWRRRVPAPENVVDAVTSDTIRTHLPTNTRRRMHRQLENKSLWWLENLAPHLSSRSIDRLPK